MQLSILGRLCSLSETQASEVIEWYAGFCELHASTLHSWDCGAQFSPNTSGEISSPVQCVAYLFFLTRHPRPIMCRGFTSAAFRFLFCSICDYDLER